MQDQPKNAFSSTFGKFVCEGDTITADVDGFTVTATIVRDDCADAPDQDDDGFWPSLDENAAGYIGENPATPFDVQQAHAESVMSAWRNDEWYYCGVVLSVSKEGVALDTHAASLWRIECNYPAFEGDDNPNAYLTEVANELLDDALRSGRAVLAKLCASAA